MADKTQKLVLSILDFLNQSISDGVVKKDDVEGLEVAVQCIGEAFGVDPQDEGHRSRLSVAPATLPSIFDVYLKTREKVSTQKPVRIHELMHGSTTDTNVDPILRVICSRSISIDSIYRESSAFSSRQRSCRETQDHWQLSDDAKAVL